MNEPIQETCDQCKTCCYLDRRRKRREYWRKRIRDAKTHEERMSLIYASNLEQNWRISDG